MTPKAPIADHETMSSTALSDEFKRLSLAVSQGDLKAEADLVKIEARLELIQRTERRRQAALAEENRIEAEAQRQLTLDAAAANVAAYQTALESKDRAFSLVEQVVEELVVAIRLAIEEGNEARAAALRLGYSGGIHASSRISSFINWKLGRDGVDCAGLSEMQPVFLQLRTPLVERVQE